MADVVAKLLSEQEARLRKEFERQLEERDATQWALRADLQAKLWERVAEIVKLEVEQRAPLEGKPGLPGKDGEPGRDGRDGLPGVPGVPGTDGKDGRDGIDGKDGAPGERGVDGVVTADALADAYKGVWAAKEYERGELVTFAGSVFLSLEKTTDKPETSEAWKLIIKRGRDGKDGKNGTKGEKGDQGPMGHYRGID